MCDFNNKITLALSLAEKGDLTQAEKICSEILDINPRHIQGRHLLAYIFIQNGSLPYSNGYQMKLTNVVFTAHSLRSFFSKWDY